VFSIFRSKKIQANDKALLETQPAPEAAAGETGWLARLKIGLSKTRDLLASDVSDLFSRHGIVDEGLFEELEVALISADVGVGATAILIDKLRSAAKAKKIVVAAELLGELKLQLLTLIRPLECELDAGSAKPFVIMIAGVNGAGKTTTIGKLAKHFQTKGLSVMLAAGDTFRAAAREQLMTWGERNNVTVIANEQGDSASVIFDAVQAARARKIDVVIADTAGRLPTQMHLMDEIRKVKRVIAKAEPGAPHEVLLVLDANTGQNAISQLKSFDDALGLTGLVVTKLDGTAKGGMIAALGAQSTNRIIPVCFIGVGEAIDDLRPFRAREFIDALL
jgi:fused signal recognition particle receptor